MRLGGTDGGPPEDPESRRPLDLSALRADDALLDALGAGLVRPGEPYPGGAESDRQLVSMLAAWVAEVRPEDVRSEDLDLSALSDREPEAVPAAAPARAGKRPKLTAVPAVPAAAAPVPVPVPDRRGWMVRHVGRRLAAAALLVGLASSGLAYGAANSTPDSAAALSRVAYAERARSVAAATQVTADLHSARTALEQGRRTEAARLIAAIGDQLPAVLPDDGRARLDRDHRRLEQVLAASGGPPAAGDLVLAADAPAVEPSDFLGDLADDNDMLVGDVPTTGGSAGGGTPPAPPTVVLAEGSTTNPAPSTADGATTDGATTDGDNSGAARPSAPDTTPDTASPDSTVPDSTAPDSTAPDSTAPDATKPDTSTPDTREDTTAPDTTAPDTTAPDTTADTGKPGTTTPETTNRETSNPATSNPATSNPATTDSDTTSPAATGSGSAGDGSTPTRSSSTRPSDTEATTPPRPASSRPAGPPPDEASTTRRTPSSTGSPARQGASGEPPETVPTTKRPKSTSPSSREFIGPVRERTLPPGRTTRPTPPTAFSPSRLEPTGPARTAQQTTTHRTTEEQFSTSADDDD